MKNAARTVIGFVFLAICFSLAYSELPNMDAQTQSVVHAANWGAQ